MTRNKDKIMEELLQLLITKLRHLQQRLDFELCADKFIHNKLINTCQDVPACQYIYFKLFNLLTGLINNLHFLIITHQKAYLIKVFVTDY